MTDEQKQAIVTSLIQMARADGKVVAEEQRLLTRLLEGLGGARDLASIPTGTDVPRLEEVLPRQAERHQLIKHLMTLSMCDGNISFTEFAYLATMAERLEVGPADLERLRDEVLARV